MYGCQAIHIHLVHNCFLMCRKLALYSRHVGCCLLEKSETWHCKPLPHPQNCIAPVEACIPCSWTSPTVLSGYQVPLNRCQLLISIPSNLGEWLLCGYTCQMCCIDLEQHAMLHMFHEVQLMSGICQWTAVDAVCYSCTVSHHKFEAAASFHLINAKLGSAVTAAHAFCTGSQAIPEH